MKRYIAAIICIIILDCIITCNKSSPVNNNPAPLCSTCSTAVVAHKADTTGLYFFLPTAFTPNGDGKNDTYRVIFDKLNADSSSLTIWDASGKGVYTASLTQSWNGTDLSGNKCAAGLYSVSMKLRTNAGATITACTCVSILEYRGNCIYTGGYTYYFADQLDINNGFVNPTNEDLCP